ncbi:phosphate transporter [Chytridium lagenaria]|nr:phosphate transporter [Chytridium lagenaria]
MSSTTAVVSMPAYSYTWVFGVTMAFAFLDAYAIGANDVANSFATSVGSRSLTLWQAVCIAIFTEFGGAMALGAETASTIRDGIIQINNFTNRPDLLMVAFMCALVASSIWVMFATYMSWPVSTTHSIIGAVIGVGISGFGTGAVNWGWAKKGVAQIVASWFLAPFLAGLLAAGIFLLTRTFVSFEQQKLSPSRYLCHPLYFTFTTAVVVFYVATKNGKSTLKIEPKDGNTGSALAVKGDLPLALGIIGGVSAAVLLFGYAFVVPYFIRRLEKEEKLKWYHLFYIHFEEAANAVDVVVEKSEKAGVDTTPDSTSNPKKDVNLVDHGPGHFVSAFFNKIKSLLYNSIFMDVASVQKGSSAETAHQVAILYDNKTEFLYSFLQVMTAAFASFGHGSNDVANALGPCAAVYQIWVGGKTITSASIPTWLLAYCAFGIDLGLAFYGYNIMRSLGNNVTFHSPSRGFAMELGAALAVITASFLASYVWMGLLFLGVDAPVSGAFAGILYAILTRGPSFSGVPGKA